MTHHEPLAMSLHRIIRTAPGVSRSALTRAVQRRARAAAVGASLDWLAGLGLVCPFVERTGGRPAEVWQTTP